MATVNYLLPSGESFQDPTDNQTYLLPSGEIIDAGVNTSSFFLVFDNN